MPDVQLNMNTDEYYRLGDLLYSLMLESHNDTAVAIAEHISGDVSSFAALMNEKAAQIGCTGTHFITPNGLDATETVDGTEYIHGTTAADLCLIMSYCIKNDTFLSITQTASHTFTNYSIGDDGNAVPGNRSFTVNNKNAFLHMMDGVISGKTGFTGNAGYCYVGACKNEGRTFIIALLGCGWPNNKSYKWKDTMKLLEYGKENFHKEVYWQEPAIPEIQVKDGVSENSTVSDESPAQSEQNLSAGLGKAAFIKGVIQAEDSDKKKEVLLKDSEKVTCNVRLQKSLAAPVKKGQKIGQVTFSIGELVLDDYFVTADRNIVKITYLWCINKVFHDFFH